MTKEKNDFAFDASALEPEKMSISMDGKTVLMYELSKKDFTEFVSSVADNIALDEPEAEEEAEEENETKENEKKEQPKPRFKDLSDQQTKDLCVFFSRSTRDTVSAEAFLTFVEEKPARAFGLLVEKFMQLNHVSEILMTRGNWLMLPMINEMMSAAKIVEAKKEKPAKTG